MNQLSCWFQILSLIAFLWLGKSSPISLEATNLPDEQFEIMVRLRLWINCTDKAYESKNIAHSHYWAMINYIRASHGNLRCCTGVTYATHADYIYLDNVGPLVELWKSPISLALYAPGGDFKPTVQSILWLRKCDPQRELIIKWVSFHIYFDFEHIPHDIPKERTLLQWEVDCKQLPPFRNIYRKDLYRSQKHMEYPVNVGRNLARNASLTHYVLVSDIELYPSPGLAKGFMEMLGQNSNLLRSQKNIVYPLNIFEIQKTTTLPNTKVKLQSLLANGQAQSFHLLHGASFHDGPHMQEWIKNVSSSNSVQVFKITKRTAKYKYWEPIYIGTTKDPLYDERFSWDGLWEKLTQAYALCILDYEFHTLDNAFLVHKPGIKTNQKSDERMAKGMRSLEIIRGALLEFYDKYGWHKNCRIL